MGKFLFSLLGIFLSINIIAQNTIIKDFGPIKKVQNINSNGFVFFYVNADNEILVKNTFNIPNRKSLNLTNYLSLNLNLLSDDFELGHLYFSDTIKFPKRINSKICNELVGQMLNNSYFKKFNENKYGLYYFDVSLYFSYSNIENLNYKMFISDSSIIIECNQYLNFFTYERQAFDKSEIDIDFYNSYEIGQTYNSLSGDLRFRREKAFKQISNIAIFNDARLKIKQYFKQYLDDINEQIIALEL